MEQWRRIRVASFCEENDEGLGKELAEFEVE